MVIEWSEIQKKLGIPIGLINSSCGGTLTAADLFVEGVNYGIEPDTILTSNEHPVTGDFEIRTAERFCIASRAFQTKAYPQ